MSTFHFYKKTVLKAILFLVALLPFCFVATAAGLSISEAKSIAPGPFEEVTNAIRKGDAESLSRYLDQNIEITISGTSNAYSKAKAKALLIDFFAKNQVKSFELIHQGQGGGGSRYGVGTLNTSTGPVRLSFFLQNKDGSMVLNELRFEGK